MRLILILLVVFLFSANKNYGQFLISGEGIMDVKIGADWDQVEWELGFKGKKVEKLNAPQELKFIAQEAGMDFDFVVRYRHIMWLPVSDLDTSNSYRRSLAIKNWLIMDAYSALSLLLISKLLIASPRPLSLLLRILLINQLKLLTKASRIVVFPAPLLPIITVKLELCSY